MKQQGIDFDVIVIGGGIVGLASAYKIQSAHPGVSIAVLEKEQKLASHQSGRNSGVIHSGLYYKPGSDKAKTCSAGRKELIAFARQHKIPCDITGKIIVATDEKQLGAIEKLFQTALENNIEGVEKISADRIRQIEPVCRGIAGIFVPATGIIDFTGVAEELAYLIEQKNRDSRILTSHEVKALQKHDFYTKVITDKNNLNARFIINCAGLQCDRLAKMDGVEPEMRIVPFRGDYYELTTEAAEKIKGLIYPVPDPAFPFLGVHFTRTINGSVECGPNAVFSFKRQGYRKTDFSMADTWDSLSYFGTWKLFLKNWKYGFGEYTRAFSKRLFLRQLQKLVPSLQMNDIKPARAGVRAQAVGPGGEVIDDFKIKKHGNSIHILNAPSPAATASLAIGDYVNRLADEQFGL